MKFDTNNLNRWFHNYYALYLRFFLGIFILWDEIFCEYPLIFGLSYGHILL